jgi:hypothetical protein
MPTPITSTISARNSAWQYSNVDLAPGQTAAITASGLWIIFPGRRTGPGGENEIANVNCPKPGARAGCLLVKTGDGTILPFSDDAAVVTTHTPGRIYLVANDELNPDQKAGHHGYEDNEGELRVSPN